jgi:SPP1 gp7 family putative phage head morphogenesis protein
MRERGEEPTTGQIWRIERMRSIQAQTEQEMARFAQFADSTITAGQREAIVAGERNAHDLLTASFPRGAGIDISFAAMPRSAVEAMVGTLADGSPLMELLSAAVADSAQGFADTMVTGLAAGWNPRRLARELRSTFGMGLTRSMRIARTEQLRAYRTASDEQYRRSGVVVEKERMAAADDRTCMACVLLDGKRYPIDEAMDDHVQGRCVFVPITRTYAEMGIDAPEPDFTREKGIDWFQRQDEATQRRMMGDAKWEAWQAGQFKLEDIPKLTENRTWGDAWTPKGLGELVGGEEVESLDALVSRVKADVRAKVDIEDFPIRFGDAGGAYGDTRREAGQPVVILDADLLRTDLQDTSMSEEWLLEWWDGDATRDLHSALEHITTHEAGHVWQLEMIHKSIMGEIDLVTSQRMDRQWDRVWREEHDQMPLYGRTKDISEEAFADLFVRHIKGRSMPPLAQEWFNKWVK